MQNIIEIKVKLRKQIDPDDVFYSIFMATEDREIPSKEETILAIENQIDFYVSKGINPDALEDEQVLLKVLSALTHWFSPLDNRNSSMFLSGNYIIVALLHIVWHGNKVRDSVTGEVFEGKH